MYEDVCRGDVRGRLSWIVSRKAAHDGDQW